MMGFVGFPQDVHSFSAAEVGAALSGLVVREPSGLPRTGMLGKGPKLTAVPASWKVEASPFVYAHTANGGTQWSGETDPVQKDIAPAASIPAGQARIDVLAWDPVAAALSVVQGTAGTNPVAPSVGALVSVGEVRVNAGDGMVLQAQITPKYQYADHVAGKISTVGPGYVASTETRLERDSTDMVDAYLVVTKSSAINSDEWMVTLPEGFRPQSNVEFAGTVSQGGAAAPVFAQIRPNGGLYVFNPSAGNKRFAGHIRYRVA